MNPTSALGGINQAYTVLFGLYSPSEEELSFPKEATKEEIESTKKIGRIFTNIFSTISVFQMGHLTLRKMGYAIKSFNFSHYLLMSLTPILLEITDCILKGLPLEDSKKAFLSKCIDKIQEHWHAVSFIINAIFIGLLFGSGAYYLAVPALVFFLLLAAAKRFPIFAHFFNALGISGTLAFSLVTQDYLAFGMGIAFCLVLGLRYLHQKGYITLPQDESSSNMDNSNAQQNNPPSQVA
jgi:hypothetical protein